MDYNSTEHPIAWFRDRYLDGTLIIKPPYQRKPVWKARQKCYLVESILMGLPIPEIYIQQTVSDDERVLYAIVDGQQRIRSILQFIGSEMEDAELEHNRFSLDMLDGSSTWLSKTYDRLSEAERKKFTGHRLAVRYLNTDNEDEIREMFRRLNKYLTPLRPQELRNATYRGPFVDLVGKLADDEYWAENRIVKAEVIRRMGDVEFISELVIGLLHGPQGGSAAVIDDYYAQYEDYEDEFPDQKTVTKLFDETKNLVKHVLPIIRDTRWENKSDFYTLFVAVGDLLRTEKLPPENIETLREALEEFADAVNRRMSNEKARVPANASNYVLAIEKGANEKSRRADRHEAITSVIGRFFVSRRPERRPALTARS